MRSGVRLLPWMLASVGLAMPLVESGFVIWFPTLFWSVPLALMWLASRHWHWRRNSTRALRVAVPLGLLPLLFITVWEGGWFLIPADLAWLAIEVADRDQASSQAAGWAGGNASQSGGLASLSLARSDSSYDQAVVSAGWHEGKESRSARE